ncbi:MAG TPA: four helix bundle protein [Gemmatimonadales bacterium]|nr:four helix bundle protein [Gemmatimonadales bacterium]
MRVIRSYHDLIVWQKAVDLAVESYRLAGQLPVDERFGLVAQLRRAASAIPANIAEGHGMETRGEFRRGVAITRGSLAELGTHFELARRLDYLSQTTTSTAERLIEEVENP